MSNKVLTRNCPICDKEFEVLNPRKIYCSKAHADKSRNVPRIPVGYEGAVELVDFNKFPQDVKNRVLLGQTGERIALYDIEATHLNASIGRVLCACIKPLGEDVEVYDAHSRKYRRPDNYDDSALVEAIRDRLEEFDIIIGHNSKMFDTKFINARNLRVGQRTKRPQYQVDTMFSWRSKSNAWSGLKNIQGFLQTPTEKTEISWGAWMNALGWDRRLRTEAMQEIVAHCIRDVEALEEVYKVLVNGDVIRGLRRDGGVL